MFRRYPKLSTELISTSIFSPMILTRTIVDLNGCITRKFHVQYQNVSENSHISWRKLSKLELLCFGIEIHCKWIYCILEINLFTSKYCKNMKEIFCWHFDKKILISLGFHYTIPKRRKEKWTFLGKASLLGIEYFWKHLLYSCHTIQFGIYEEGMCNHEITLKSSFKHLSNFLRPVWDSSNLSWAYFELF